MTIGQPLGGPTDMDIFSGDVLYRRLVTEDDAELIRSIVATFRPGGRTKWHHHGCDQLLIITGGHGIVATEDEELRVREGDLVFVPAGTKHWHGSDGETELTHISVLTPGSEDIDE